MTETFDDTFTDLPKTEKKEKKSHRMACGLTWPQSGNPFFYCAVRESYPDQTLTFETIESKLEIFEEGPARSMTELTDKLKELPLRNVYCEIDPEHSMYIREFNRWKRGSGSRLRLRATSATNFEASILKIKSCIKRIAFPPTSLVRTQLSIFTKLSLKAPEDFYAVLSLCNVIPFFDKRASVDEMDRENTEVPSLKSWY